MPSSEPRATIGTFASARTTTLLTFAAAIIGVVLGVAVTLDLNAPNTSNTPNTAEDRGAQNIISLLNATSVGQKIASLLSTASAGQNIGQTITSLLNIAYELPFDVTATYSNLPMKNFSLTLLRNATVNIACSARFHDKDCRCNGKCGLCLNPTFCTKNNITILPRSCFDYNGTTCAERNIGTLVYRANVEPSYQHTSFQDFPAFRSSPLQMLPHTSTGAISVGNELYPVRIHKTDKEDVEVTVPSLELIPQNNPGTLMVSAQLPTGAKNSISYAVWSDECYITYKHNVLTIDHGDNSTMISYTPFELFADVRGRVANAWVNKNGAVILEDGSTVVFRVNGDTGRILTTSPLQPLTFETPVTKRCVLHMDSTTDVAGWLANLFSIVMASSSSIYGVVVACTLEGALDLDQVLCKPQLKHALVNIFKASPDVLDVMQKTFGEDQSNFEKVFVICADLIASEILAIIDGVECADGEILSCFGVFVDAISIAVDVNELIEIFTEVGATIPPAKGSQCYQNNNDFASNNGRSRYLQDPNDPNKMTIVCQTYDGNITTYPYFTNETECHNADYDIRADCKAKRAGYPFPQNGAFQNPRDDCIFLDCTTNGAYTYRFDHYEECREQGIYVGYRANTCTPVTQITQK